MGFAVKVAHAVIAFALLISLRAEAAETPETILIRQTLSADLSGHRRGDLDLVLSAYDEYLAAYDGNGSSDPRGWSIRHEGREALRASIEQDLQANRYETVRTVPTIQVRGNVATATTIDSGRVVDRQTGAARTVYEKRLWTLFKREDNWRVTAFVTALGDSTARALLSENGEVSAVLAREEEAREAGDSGDLLSIFAENFSGYDGKESLNPAAWKIIFSGTEEFEKHLVRRLPHVAYQVDRQLLSTQVGPQQREAIAVTRDKVQVTHERGESEHALERYVLWTLSKRDGGWKITNMLYNLGPSE